MPKAGQNLTDVSPVDAEGQPYGVSLDLIREQLALSALAVDDALEQGLAHAGPFSPYDHAIYFLQHLVWHEGYHAGLLLLALRNVGREPSEMWQEQHIWELWRGPEVWD